MGEVAFEVRYTDEDSGEEVAREVSEGEAAWELACDLISASGGRAVIERKHPDQLWAVYAVDAKTGQVEIAWSGLTKSQVLQRWEKWSESRTGCVLVAWPEWLELGRN